MSDELVSNFEKLGVRTTPVEKASKQRRNQAFHESLQRTQFMIFDHIADLGYYQWTPMARFHGQKISEVTADDIKSNVHSSAVPDSIARTIHRSLPRQIEVMADQIVTNTYPHGKFYVASMYVAVKERGVDYESIDFFFGGATLEMLASTTIPPNSEFLVTVIPGTRIIIVVKYSIYEKNYADPGFQFERLLTGKPVGKHQDEAQTEHLQLMKVNNRLVLFASEADAIENGDPVEIKVSNPRYWGTKTMFQMISIGSPTLYAGRKNRFTFFSVMKKNLHEVARTATAGLGVRHLELNITKGMKTLREAEEDGKFDGGKAYSIEFIGSQMILTPYKGGYGLILPPEKEIDRLMGISL